MASQLGTQGSPMSEGRKDQPMWFDPTEKPMQHKSPNRQRAHEELPTLQPEWAPMGYVKKV